MSCQLKTIDVSEDVTVVVTADDFERGVHESVGLGLWGSGATDLGFGSSFDDMTGVLVDVFGFGGEIGGGAGVVLGAVSCLQQEDNICIYGEFSRQHTNRYLHFIRTLRSCDVIFAQAFPDQLQWEAMQGGDTESALVLSSVVIQSVIR